MTQQVEGNFPLSLKVRACANGETYEYLLVLLVEGGYWQIGESRFRTPLIGDSISTHAAAALHDILADANREAPWGGTTNDPNI